MIGKTYRKNLAKPFPAQGNCNNCYLYMILFCLSQQLDNCLTTQVFAETRERKNLGKQVNEILIESTCWFLLLFLFQAANEESLARKRQIIRI